MLDEIMMDHRRAKPSLREGNPGRIRKKLAELIEAEGLDCRPDELIPTQGCWRNKTLDGMDGTRWWGSAYVIDFHGLPHGFRIQFHGYHTMTECVKWGIEIVRDSNQSWSYDVYAKDRTDVE